MVKHTPTPIVFNTKIAFSGAPNSTQSNPKNNPLPTQIKPAVLSTPLPSGPELNAYLPNRLDFPQCQTMSYSISTYYASARCALPYWNVFSIFLSGASKNMTPASLKLAANFQNIVFPQVGQGSLAGQNATGKSMQALFYKGNTQVTVSYSVRFFKADADKVLEIAKWMEQKIPDKIILPLKLSFPDTLQSDRLTSYFSSENFWVFHNNRYENTQDYYQGDKICLYVAPIKTDHNSWWMAALYDLQKKQIVKKMMWDMSAQKVCGGLEPTYAKDKYQTGDQYEIRLAVDNSWVATYPFTTK